MDITVDALLARATRTLDDAHIDAPRQEARWLLELIPPHTMAYQLAHGDAPVASDARSRYLDLVARRARGTPFAYLAGFVTFDRVRLVVGPGVLIPRPETEALCSAWRRALIRERCHGALGSIRLLDVGTGTGAIGIAVASALEGVTRVDLTDLSAEALTYARTNVAAYASRLPSETTVCQADLYDTWRDWNVILTNPPYIDVDHDPDLADDVKASEPRLALDGHKDGLDVIRRLIARVAADARDDVYLGLEHGHRQAEAVHALGRAYGFTPLQTLCDDRGCPRGVFWRLSPCRARKERVSHE